MISYVMHSTTCLKTLHHIYCLSRICVCSQLETNDSCCLRIQFGVQASDTHLHSSPSRSHALAITNLLAPIPGSIKFTGDAIFTRPMMRIASFRFQSAISGSRRSASQAGQQALRPLLYGLTVPSRRLDVAETCINERQIFSRGCVSTASDFINVIRERTRYTKN